MNRLQRLVRKVRLLKQINSKEMRVRQMQRDEVIRMRECLDLALSEITRLRDVKKETA